MSEAMKLIVAGYVGLKDSSALELLHTHRHKALTQLQTVSGVSSAKAIEAIQKELEIIESAIQDRGSRLGPRPDNVHSMPSDTGEIEN